MNKYLVIGNPIEHSLSPKLHNFWIKVNNLDAIYEKKKINENKLADLILEIKKKNIHGINVTVPFKKAVIPYLDKLTFDSESTQSVNTIHLEDDKLVGHNTDIEGFERSIQDSKLNLINKKALVLGAGGVVPSIIFALNKMKLSEVIISNRTKSKAESLKDLFKNIKIVEWGEIPEFDIIINATSVGLKNEDKIDLDISKIGKDKFFYDVIYKPSETNFLKVGKKPLYRHTLNNIIKTNKFDEIHISSEKIVNKKYQSFLRPKSLTKNKTTLDEVIFWTINKYISQGIKFDVICLAYATSPLIESKDYSLALKKFEKTNRKNPLISAVVPLILSASAVGVKSSLDPPNCCIVSTNLPAVIGLEPQIELLL